MNSSRTTDSAILTESGDGFSGSDLGLAYAKTGTYRTTQARRESKGMEEAFGGSGLGCRINSRDKPFGLVAKVDCIPLHVGFGLLKRELYLNRPESAHRTAGYDQE